MMSADIRAIGAVSIFSYAGIISIVLFPPNMRTLPLFAIYCLLLWNTYLSVRYFSTIVPARNISQIVIDVLLCVLYVMLAFSLPNILWFHLILSVLFIIAILKYMMAIPYVSSPKLLTRKIRIDVLGAIGSALTFLGALFGYPFTSSIFWAILFFFVTLYLVFFKPLYRADSLSL